MGLSVGEETRFGMNHAAEEGPKERRKNVIWFISDQHRGQAMGIHGDPNVSTPNMDWLARTGCDFEMAYSGMPLCSPFRGSMLTSRYPHHCVPGHEYPLDPKLPTVASVFREHGYETLYLGKWHLDGFHESEGRAAFHLIPKERRGGFEKWLGYENNNSPWDSYVHGDMGEGEVMKKLEGYETDALTALLLQYLDEDRERPFFAVISVQPPHDPFIAPPEFMGGRSRGSVEFRQNVPSLQKVRDRAAEDLAGYYGMIENVDWNLGRVIGKLRDRKLLEQTHVMYFSDHGDMMGSHGQFRKMTPYEEAVRIPFLIGGEIPMDYGTRGCKAVKRVMINHVDIAPTTLGLCGIEKPVWMEGFDYSFCRLNRSEKHDEIPDSVYLQSVAPNGGPDSVDQPWRGIVTMDGWKYVRFHGMPWLLYHLTEDPLEEVNLAHNGEFREKRLELEARLREWEEKTGDFESSRIVREEKV